MQTVPEHMTRKASESAAAAKAVPGRVMVAAAVMVFPLVAVTEAGADVEND